MFTDISTPTFVVPATSAIYSSGLKITSLGNKSIGKVFIFMGKKYELVINCNQLKMIFSKDARSHAA